MKFQQLISLAGDYFATLAALGRTEAAADLQALRSAAVRIGIAAGIALLGVLWLNAALLLWLLRTDYPIVASIAIGVVALVTGWLLIRAGGRRLPRGVLPRTREVARNELAAMGVIGGDEVGGDEAGAAQDGQGVDRPPVPPTLSPEGANARLRELRIEIGQILAPPRGATYVDGGEPPPSLGFQPKSRTMRWMVDAYQTGAASRLPGIAASVAGVLATRSPKLRRSMAMLALLRGIGRAAGQRMRRA